MLIEVVILYLIIPLLTFFRLAVLQNLQICKYPCGFKRTFTVIFLHESFQVKDIVSKNLN